MSGRHCSPSVFTILFAFSLSRLPRAPLFPTRHLWMYLCDCFSSSVSDSLSLCHGLLWSRWHSECFFRKLISQKCSAKIHRFMFLLWLRAFFFHKKFDLFCNEDFVCLFGFIFFFSKYILKDTFFVLIIIIMLRIVKKPKIIKIFHYFKNCDHYNLNFN